MSKSNAFETALLSLVFNGDSISGIAEDTSSAPATNLYWSLHTADPGEAGDQTTNECAYTSYARVATARTSSGFSVSGNSVSPVAQVTFPTATGGSETATYGAIGRDSSGAGLLLYSGAITPNIVISTSVQPILNTASSCTED